MLLKTTYPKTYGEVVVDAVDVSTLLTDVANAAYNNMISNPQNLVDIINNAMSQEELWDDKSCNWYVALQYEYALILATLIYIDIEENGVNTDDDYYEDKYNLAQYSEYLACNKISLKKILDGFGIGVILQPNFGVMDIDTPPSPPQFPPRWGN